MDSFTKILGKIIARHRGAAKLSQEELAYAAGVHRTYISQIERGLKSPTINVLRKISTNLDTSLSGLIGEIEQEMDHMVENGD